MEKKSRRKKINRRKKTRRKRGGVLTKDEALRWIKRAEKMVKKALPHLDHEEGEFYKLDPNKKQRYMLAVVGAIARSADESGYGRKEINEAKKWFLAKIDAERIVAAGAKAVAAKNIEHREDVYRGHLHKLGVKTGEKLYQNKNPTGGRRRRKTRRKRGKRGKGTQSGGHHLYKRLGVSKYASRKQIKSRYKKLKSQRKLTKKIKEAYKVLSNERSRKRYNQSYRRRTQRGGFLDKLMGETEKITSEIKKAAGALDLPTSMVSSDEKGGMQKILPRTISIQQLDPPKYDDATKRNFKRWDNLINNDMQKLYNRSS